MYLMQCWFFSSIVSKKYKLRKYHKNVWQHVLSIREPSVIWHHNTMKLNLNCDMKLSHFSFLKLSEKLNYSILSVQCAPLLCSWWTNGVKVLLKTIARSFYFVNQFQWCSLLRLDLSSIFNLLLDSTLSCKQNRDNERIFSAESFKLLQLLFHTQTCIKLKKCVGICYSSVQRKTKISVYEFFWRCWRWRFWGILLLTCVDGVDEF